MTKRLPSAEVKCGRRDAECTGEGGAHVERARPTYSDFFRSAHARRSTVEATAEQKAERAEKLLRTRRSPLCTINFSALTGFIGNVVDEAFFM